MSHHTQINLQGAHNEGQQGSVLTAIYLRSQGRGRSRGARPALRRRSPAAAPRPTGTPAAPSLPAHVQRHHG